MECLGTKIEKLKRKSHDIVEEKKAVNRLSETNSVDRDIIKELLDSPLRDEEDYEAIQSIDNALISDYESISERMEKNDEDCTDTLGDIDNMMDLLKGNLDKLEKIYSASDLVSDSSNKENTRKRIEELETIRKLLGEEDDLEYKTDIKYGNNVHLLEDLAGVGQDADISDDKSPQAAVFSGRTVDGDETITGENTMPESKSISWNAKLKDKARAFFNSAFSSDSELKGKALKENSTQSIPVNQILANAISAVSGLDGKALIREQFDALKTIEVNSLSKENLHMIVEIAIQNLKDIYGSREAASKFDSIGKKIAFISDRQVQRELGHSYRPDISGYYSPALDAIRINMDGNANVGDVLATVDHEAMHLLSKNSKSQGGVTNPNIVYDNVGMNEGITEMLSIKDMQNINPNYISTSYIDEVKIMKDFESICGEKQLLDAYMRSDVSLIATEFNYLLGSQKAFEKFCNDIDQLYYYNYVNPKEIDAPVQRRDIKNRIYQKLDQYRKAKMNSTDLEIASVASDMNLWQNKKRDTDSNRQFRFGFGKRKHDSESITVENLQAPTERERHISFVEKQRIGLSLEEQAEYVRNWGNTAAADNDDSYKEERQRSKYDDRDL